MTNAFSIFVNGGRILTPYIIDHISDANDNIIDPQQNITINYSDDINQIPDVEQHYEKISDERSLFQTLSLLNGVMRRGSARYYIKNIKLNNLFGKSGTSNDSKDVWFIGGNAQIIVGVYIGYDQPQTMGKRITGSNTAVPAFSYFMEQIQEQLSDIVFMTPPEGIVKKNINYNNGNITDLETDNPETITEYFKTEQIPSPTEDSTETYDKIERDNSTEDENFIY
jgi:penicillin-binding protein 1A